MNKLNSGSLDKLQPGECLLIGARKVANGKIQLEFAEKISASNRPMSALTILNASDSKFSSGARRSWATAEPVDASEIYNVNFGDDGEWYASERGEMMDLNILNPTWNGFLFRVQIIETTEATEWQEANVETAAKRAGQGGDFITHNGDYIFSNTTVVLLTKDSEPVHTFLASDTTQTNSIPNTGTKEFKAVEEDLKNMV